MPRILLIEDNDSNRDLISRYLNLFDYDVMVAVDGLEGLLQVQANRECIDLILMDMNLPEIDGWELARRIKANPATKSLPIIALTSHAMVGDREKALNAGVTIMPQSPLTSNSSSARSKHLPTRYFPHDEFPRIITRRG